MTQSKPFYRRAIYYLLLLILTLLFAAVFQFSVSPVVTESTEFDVSCFHVIGRAMASGQMPYLDFLDNKGPVLYVVYMFASLMFPFPWGIFLISALLNFCSLVLLNRICQRLRIANSFWIILLYLFFYTCVCSNGGLTEDFSLPLTLAAFLVYLYVDASLKEGGFRLSSGLLLGLLFWLCAFTRVNNALSIALITASIGVQLLLKKEWKKTAAFVGAFAAGSVIIVLPVVLWLSRNGALKEFLNQFLLNNFKYSAAEDAISKVDLFFHNRFGLQLFFLVGVGILGAIVFFLRNRNNRLPLFITTLVVLFGTAASYVSMTKAFPHYLLIILIPAFFGFMLAFAHRSDPPERTKKSRWIVPALAVLCCVGMIFTFSGKLKVERGLFYMKEVSGAVLNGTLFEKTAYEQSIDRLAGYIPVEERDSVYSIDIEPNFYAYSGITPAKRMFVCQSLFTGISAEYYDEFVSYFTNDPPKWLLTEKPLETIYLCGTHDSLVASYRFVDKALGLYNLYQWSEPDETH
jgi:hypothetical protein